MCGAPLSTGMYIAATVDLASLDDNKVKVRHRCLAHLFELVECYSRFLFGGGFFGGGEGFGDVVEVVGGAVYADEGGVAFAVVVVEVGGGDEGVGLEDEVDGFGLALGVFDGGLEGVAGEDVAVDGDDLLAGDELGFVGGAVPADVGDDAFAADAEADGVPDVECRRRGGRRWRRWCAEDLVGLSVKTSL